MLETQYLQKLNEITKSEKMKEWSLVQVITMCLIPKKLSLLRLAKRLINISWIKILGLVIMILIQMLLKIHWEM